MKYYKKDHFWFYNFVKDTFELHFEISIDSKFYDCCSNDCLCNFDHNVRRNILSILRKLYVKNLL